LLLEEPDMVFNNLLREAFGGGGGGNCLNREHGTTKNRRYSFNFAEGLSRCGAYPSPRKVEAREKGDHKEMIVEPHAC
jgi:hypothetical protein